MKENIIVFGQNLDIWIIVLCWADRGEKKKIFTLNAVHKFGCDAERLRECFVRYSGWNIFSLKSNLKFQNQTSLLPYHSMAMGNLNKSKEITPTTTTALKVAPQRTIFHKNWNPPFWTSLHKIFKNCFLWSKSCCTIFTFTGTFIK